MTKNLTLAACALLIGWMIGWSHEYVRASNSASVAHMWIDREQQQPPVFPRAMAAGEQERFNQEWREDAQQQAAHARASMAGLIEERERAKFMLLNVSGWSVAVLVLGMLLTAASRWRVRLVRKT